MRATKIRKKAAPTTTTTEPPIDRAALKAWLRKKAAGVPGATELDVDAELAALTDEGIRAMFAPHLARWAAQRNPVGLSGALLRLRARADDPAAVRTLLGGGGICSSIDEVAAEFGVHPAVIERWQTEGMPGGPVTGSAVEQGPPPASEFWPPSARNCELLRALDVDPDGSFADYSLLLGGETTAATLADVAKAFDVSIQSIKAWASMGMPKPAKGQPYQLVAILSWRVIRDRKADTRLG